MRFALPILIAACDVSAADERRRAVEPIPVALNGGWTQFGGSTQPVLLGPHQGAPPMLFATNPLRPDNLLMRVQAEVDRYPPRVLRLLIDRVVVGTQLSLQGERFGHGLLGIVLPYERVVLLTAEPMNMAVIRSTLHHEIGHVLHGLTPPDTFAQWTLLSDTSEAASYLDGPSATGGAFEDWAEYVAALQTRPRWLRARACKVPDVAVKAAFVQLQMARLGVTLDRPFDVSSCVAEPAGGLAAP